MADPLYQSHEQREAELVAAHQRNRDAVIAAGPPPSHAHPHGHNQRFISANGQTVDCHGRRIVEEPKAND